MCSLAEYFAFSELFVFSIHFLCCQLCLLCCVACVLYVVWVPAWTSFLCGVALFFMFSVSAAYSELCSLRCLCFTIFALCGPEYVLSLLHSCIFYDFDSWIAVVILCVHCHVLDLCCICVFWAQSWYGDNAENRQQNFIHVQHTWFWLIQWTTR